MGDLARAPTLERFAPGEENENQYDREDRDDKSADLDDSALVHGYAAVCSRVTLTRCY